MNKLDRGQKIAFFCALLSLFALGYLTLHYFDLRLGVVGQSICNINATFDCDAVAASPFSTLFGAPISILGFFTNLTLILFILASVYGAHSAIPRNKFYAFGLALFICVMSVLMAIITVTQIHSVCLFCLTSYILSIGSLLGTYSSFKSVKKNIDVPDAISHAFKSGEDGSLWVTILIVAIIPASLILGNMIESSYQGDLGKVISGALEEWQASPPVQFVSPEALTKGADPEKAKMTIVEFADFNCIHCKMAVPVIKSFVKSRSDVRLIFQSFPLDGTCNAAITQSGDGIRCQLAKAALCANKQSKGWETHDWIYEHFGLMNEAEISKMAAMLNLNIEEFNKCLNDPETQQLILAQAERGKKANVDGTPAIFVNGKHLPYGNYFPVLEAVYKTLK